MVELRRRPGDQPILRSSRPITARLGSEPVVSPLVASLSGTQRDWDGLRMMWMILQGKREGNELLNDKTRENKGKGSSVQGIKRCSHRSEGMSGVRSMGVKLATSIAESSHSACSV